MTCKNCLEKKLIGIKVGNSAVSVADWDAPNRTSPCTKCLSLYEAEKKGG